MKTDIQEIESAAENGSAEAQNLLGLIYGEGRDGVTRDIVRAVACYEKAAAQGMPAAQYNLAVHYEEGEGVPKDYVKAIQLYRQAAEQGSAVAQHAMGRLRRDAGREEDLQDAMLWFRKAADQGYRASQTTLGVLYAQIGNFPEAAFWYRRSAEQGHPFAQNELGVLFWEGKGVPKDFIESYKWLNLAASRGNKNAEEGLDIVGKRMTREQIAEGQRRTAEFVPRDEQADQDKPANSSQPDGFQDVTNLVERLELFEERLGVRIEALKATYFVSTENIPWLRLCGEVHPRNGVQIKYHVRIIVDVYDSSGGLSNSGFQWLSEPAEFFGFETFRVEVNVEKFAKLRVYPKRS